jgi:hypothetical protein
LGKPERMKGRKRGGREKEEREIHHGREKAGQRSVGSDTRKSDRRCEEGNRPQKLGGVGMRYVMRFWQEMERNTIDGG